MCIPLDPEKHKDVNSATDEDDNQATPKNDWLEMWKSPEVIVTEDDGEYD